MTEEPVEIVRGSGNVFRDFGHPDADREQLRAILAAKIIGVLDDRGLSVRDAQALTGVAAADFSRIRRANLGRFTIDRLMTILGGLGQVVEISVQVHPRREPEAATAPTHL
ncbi:MAG: helix-turn-helix domain-containing protein [Bradyrhizobium sp.]